MLRQIFDDVTLCKHVTAEENAYIVFNSFSYTKKHLILAIYIVIVQIVILIMSLPSGTGFYVMSSLIQDVVFSSRKMGCIRCISSKVYNKDPDQLPSQKPAD